MENTVTALEMRKKFGSIIDRVAQKGEHITIMRGDKPLATVVPVEEHQRSCRQHGRLKTVQEVMADLDAWKKANPHKMKKLSQLDSVKLIRQMRNSRWSSTPRSS